MIRHTCRDQRVLSSVPFYEEGQISLSQGFLPKLLTSRQLPNSHCAWDEAAANLPSLFYSSGARSCIEKIPVLSAEEEALPDQALARAGVILSALAHAYWRFGAKRFFAPRTTQVATNLPSSIRRPWVELSRRLGRVHPEAPFQNFYDLFLANFRLREGVAERSAPVAENIRVLVPTFDNEAEHVFNAAFVEMHYRLTPVVESIGHLRKAMAVDNFQAVQQCFNAIRLCLKRATRVWEKLGARQGDRFFCDPVLWSKTVAIIGVPPNGCTQGGTSGACAPAVYILDALVGRRRFSSDYGEYLRREAAPLVPRPVHNFAAQVSALKVRGYVESHSKCREGAPLQESWERLVEAFCGRRGWLGRHVSKAFSFLCTSTLVGRNASVSGHERYSARHTWERAAENLNLSRQERREAGSQVSVQTRECQSLSGEMSFSEVSRCVRKGQLLIIVDQEIYNLSQYAASHPGGHHILWAYAGRDATSVFYGQNAHAQTNAFQQAQRYRVARLRVTSPRRQRYVDFTVVLLRSRQISLLQFDHPMQSELRLKLFSDEHAHQQVLLDFLPVALRSLGDSFAEPLLCGPEIKDLTESSQWLSLALDYSGELTAPLMDVIEQRCSALKQLNLVLFERLLRVGEWALESPACEAEVARRVERAVERVLGAYLSSGRRSDTRLRCQLRTAQKSGVGAPM